MKEKIKIKKQNKFTEGQVAKDNQPVLHANEDLQIDIVDQTQRETSKEEQSDSRDEYADAVFNLFQNNS